MSVSQVGAADCPLFVKRDGFNLMIANFNLPPPSVGSCHARRLLPGRLEYIALAVVSHKAWESSKDRPHEIVNIIPISVLPVGKQLISYVTVTV